MSYLNDNGGSYMATASILLIGGVRARDDKFLAALQKQYNVLVAASGQEATEYTSDSSVAILILDAVAMRSSGDRICRQLKEAFPTLPIIHIHPGPRDKTKSIADVILFHPLTAKRLVNSVGRLIHVDEEEVIETGPFRMNVPRRILIAHGKETQLTPKQALLVETFLRNPGKTLDRKMLMEQVWETDYLGDTRTLDVHIRWIRKVMEDGGKRPRYLKTVRGVGYCLEISDNKK
jgi:DNA-binding response OmpR family regulator